MGRPPIGKIAMTSAERVARYRLKHGIVTKPVTKGSDHSVLARELARAKAAAAAEIAALRAELARERKQREAAEAKHSAPAANVDDEAPTTGGPVGKQVFKILLKLDDANDNTVLTAARKLVNALKTNGSDLRVLADALGAEAEKQRKAKPAPPPTIDWAEVTAAVNKYAADRTTVNLTRVWSAAKVAVPALDEYRGRDADTVAHHISSCLRRLGFTGSSSGRTWHRK